MIQLDIKTRAVKFIRSLPPKHQRQIKEYLLALQQNPKPHDSKLLIGYTPYRRGDVGEYRIIYSYDESSQIITIALIGKRNDGNVYQALRRMNI